MKQVITIVAALIALAPSASMADGRWRAPDRHERHEGGVNPWPFIAGAVVGGIIVHAAEADEPRVVTSRPAEKPILVNGVWMQRTVRCVQEIVTNARGDETVVNRCNYIYVPIQTEPSN